VLNEIVHVLVFYKLLLYFILSFLCKKRTNAYISRVRLYTGSKLVVWGASYLHTILQ